MLCIYILCSTNRELQFRSRDEAGESELVEVIDNVAVSVSLSDI